MKPFVNDPNKPMGGSTEALKYSWNFQRKSWAKAKRDSRRKRRRTDKQDLNNETR